MKRERNTSITKVKKRKTPSSSNSSDIGDSTEENPTMPIDSSPRNEGRSSAKKTKTQTDITVRLQNADMFSKYKNKHPHLVIDQPKTTSNYLASEISDDDEIWLCEIPNGIDAIELVGKTIKLGSKRCFVETENGTIECASEKYQSNEVYQNSVSVAFQNNESQFIIKNIKPVGRLTFRTKANDLVDNPLENAPQVKPHKCTIFPDNIIVRHPLHGHQFEDRIKVKKNVQEALKHAEEASMQTTTRLDICDEIATVSKPKKSKKRKADSQLKSESDSAKKLKTEIKVENDDDLSWIKSL